MADLSERQEKILKTLIEEYIETADPVGSEALERKYELGVSPATIRNEMAVLTKDGFLKQPHTSAGRVPTKEAFKFYVGHLMKEKELSVTDEVAAKEKVWDARFDLDRLMKQTVKALAEKTQSLAVAATEGGDIYHAGYANILQLPEFYDIDITRTILSLLDEAKTMQNLFGKCFGEGPVHLLLGDELGYDFLDPCGMIFARFKVGSKKSGALGVIGANRFDYAAVVPMVRYFGHLIEELGQNL